MDEKRFTDWHTQHQNNPVEKLPWFNKDLDADLADELSKRKIHGGSFLDLGTGPGTQAAKLASLGFSVTGTDISESAIKSAQKTSTDVSFVSDDILSTRLAPNSFDYVFDRGCFHVLPPQTRTTYAENVRKILKENGLFFLKCFSTKELTDYGPYKFSKQDLENIFSLFFEIESCHETAFQGTLPVFPKALFAVIKKKH